MKWWMQKVMPAALVFTPIDRFTMHHRAGSTALRNWL